MHKTATRSSPAADSVQIRDGSDLPRLNNATTQAAAHVEHLREIRSEGTRRDRDGMRRGNLTIPVLVEEAEGLLELGDLVVGELVRHGGEGSDRSEREAGSGSGTGEEGLGAFSGVAFAGIFLPRFIRASTRRGRHIRQHPNIFSPNYPWAILFPFSTQIKPTQNPMSFFTMAYKECSDEIQTEQSIYTRRKSLWQTT